MLPNPAAKRFAGLDHLRALAIILVFIYHYRIFGNPPLVQSLGGFGWTGVDLFFVLSGYLIGGQLLSSIARGKDISYGEFYFKRFLRIIPAYLVVVLLYFTIPAFKERSELPPLWKFLTFTQNFGLDLSREAAFSHAWSLCIEEQFYLLLPLLLIPLANTKAIRKGIWLALGIFLFGFCIRWYNWNHFIQPMQDQDGFWITWYKWMYYPTYTRLDGLLVGVCLAALSNFAPRFWERITRHGNLILILSLAVLTGAYFCTTPQETILASVAGFPLISIGYGLMVLGALSPTSILYKTNSRFTTLIATLSYSIYLTHKQLIHLTQLALDKWGISHDSYWLFGTCVITAFLGGLVLHYTVEKPFLQLRDKILNRRKKQTLVKI